MPDLFVPADTSNYSDYYRSLIRRGILNSYALEYSDKNRQQIKLNYKVFDDFKNSFSFSDKEIAELIKKAEDSGIKFNESQFKISKGELLNVLKGYVAANIWQLNEFYRIINEDDPTIKGALSVISDKSAYDKILGYE